LKENAIYQVTMGFINVAKISYDMTPKAFVA
jgi:hypothetical protein